jgi:predicted nuclease with TOPRIM domain
MKQWMTVLIAAMAWVPMVALAEGESERIKPVIPSLGGPKYNLLTPIKDMLSGRPWLILSGLDPVLNKGKGFNQIEQANPYSASPRMQAGGAGIVPFRDPAPAFSRGVLITRDFSASPFQTEPHMAVNPTDPDHVVVGVIDYAFDSLVSYVSYDGGSTWEGPYQAPYPSQDLASAGDPVLAFDRKGRLYMAGISLGIEEFNLGALATESLVSSISLARSDDGGETWVQSVSSSRSKVSTQGLQQDRFGRTRGTVSVGFLDKPWLGIGPDPQNKDNDIIYVVYTDFEEQAELYYLGEVPVLVGTNLLTTIRMVSSRDQGKTWSDPIAVSPTVRRGSNEGGSDPDDPDRIFVGENQQPGAAPTAEGKKRIVQGPQVNVGKDGTVYFSWMDSLDDDNTKGLGEIQVATSTDGGKTIKRLGAAATFNEIPYKPRTNPFRFWASSFPQTALGPDGEIYIVYSGRPPDKAMDDADVYLVSSMDKGLTWSRPTRLNGDEGTALQFLPAIDVDPKGRLHAMWLDTRDDKSRLRYHVYYTTSEDKGKTWGFEIKQIGQRVRDSRVSDFSTNPNRAFPGGAFIGDYVAIKSTEEDVYLIWPDGRLAEFGGYNQKIGFARQRPINSPAVSVTPPAGAGGQSVVIQGFSFQPESEILVQLGDAIISSTRSNSEGRFTLNLYMPLTAEGPQTVRVFDASGNGASASYFTEFGFNNLQASGKDIKELQNAYKELIELLKSQNGQNNQAGVKELQTSVSALQASQKDLLSAVSANTDNAQAASSAVKELQTSLSALQASQKTLVDTVNNGVTNSAQSANTNAQAANSQAQAANNSIKELQTAITALQASQKSLLEAVTNGLSNNSQANTNAQAANSGIKDLQTAITALQASQKSLMDSLGSSNAQTTKDLKDLQASVIGLQVSNQGLQTSNQGLQTVNKELQASLSALQASYRELQNSFAQLQTNYKGLQAAYQDMLKRIDEVNKKLPVPQKK